MLKFKEICNINTSLSVLLRLLIVLLLIFVSSFILFNY